MKCMLFVASHEIRSISLIKRIFSVLDATLEFGIKSEEVKTQQAHER